MVWLKTTMTKLSKKSELAKAIHYALERWTALMVFVDAGRVEMDNNAAERGLRTVAVGRKKLSLCRRRTCCGDLQSARIGEVERHRSGGIHDCGAAPHCRSSDQPDHRLLPWNLCPAAGEKTEVRDTQIQLNRNRVHHRALAETIQNETRTLLMNWQTLESEMLASVAYDAEKQILFLRFRKTGDVYRYFRFPAAEYHAFIIAESHGRFFLAHIRDKYPNERMAKLRAA